MASLQDLFSYSWSSLSHRKLRSYLTVLGVVIGVASVVTLFSISDGLYASVEGQLQAFGANNAVVVPGAISAAPSGGGYAPPSQGKLFEKDFQRVKSVPGVAVATRTLMASTILRSGDEEISLRVAGVEPSEFFALREIELESGRLLVDNDRGAAVIPVRYTEPDSVFKDKPLQLGSLFQMGEGERARKFRVIGVMSASSPAGSNVYVQFEDAKYLAGNTISPNEISQVQFQVADGFDFDEAISNVEFALSSAHKLKVEDKDFSIVTSKFILEQVGQIIGILSAVLGLITGISLIVGAVGIANTMYMSVTERTQEIGILKAVGASSADVLQLIILESAIIGFVGALIGLAAGFAISLVVSLFGFTTVVSPYVVAFVMVFGVAIGVLSGLVPARRAASLSPIVAITRG